MSSKPHVILAGAGPGDPELITLKLQQRLGIADIIITDRLVNPEIISLHARAGVRIIKAGKQGYNDRSFTQEEVTQLLIEEARSGKTVLRLKGGDVAFFSNVLDELEALVAAGISYEIIPGITAASGMSAYTGIPLTARNYAQGVRFLAFNPGQQPDDKVLQSIAESGDTLVIYMAVKNLVTLTAKLIQFNADPARKLAVVEQATTNAQQIHLSNIADATNDFARSEFSSPSLVVIGDVLQLHGRFDWFFPERSSSVFEELE